MTQYNKSFILKKESVQAFLPFKEPEISELNTINKRKNIENSLDFLSNKNVEEFKSADFSLLEQLEIDLINIKKYELSCKFIDPKLADLKNRIEKLIEKADTKPAPMQYNHNLFIELFFDRISYLKTRNKQNILKLIEEITGKVSKKDYKEIEPTITDKAIFKKKEEKVFRLTSNIFEFKLLTKEERQYLLYFSILPPVEIKFSELIRYFDISNDSIEEFKNILNKLAANSWLQKNNDIYKINPFLQSFLRYKLKPNAKNCKTVIINFSKLLHCEPSENPISKKSFIPFAESILNYIDEVDNEVAVLSHNLGIVCYHLNTFKLAEKYFDKTITILINNPLSKKEHLAISYSNIALIHSELRNFEKALEYEFIAKEIIENNFGKNDILMAGFYNNIALIYRDLKDYQKALDFILLSKKIAENFYNSPHPNLAACYNSIALIYNDLKDYNKSLEYNLKAINIVRSVFDKNHPYLATSYNNLSMVYIDLGDYQKALEYSFKAKNIVQTIYNADNPFIATIYDSIAASYFYLKNYSDAQQYINKSIDILKLFLPNDIERYNVSIAWKEKIDQALKNGQKSK